MSRRHDSAQWFAALQSKHFPARISPEMPQMVYYNPNFDPCWEERHDRHAAARDLAWRDMDRLIKSGQWGTSEYEDAVTRQQKHNDACIDALNSQHQTIAQYAKWWPLDFPPGVKFPDLRLKLPAVDCNAFQTTQEVDATWSRQRSTIQEAAYEQVNGLPRGQPAGLRAFSNASSPNLKRLWQEFRPLDLFEDGGGKTVNTRTLVTTEELPDGWHICFMQDWNCYGCGVSSNIERLATAVYNEAGLTARQQSKKMPRGMFRRLWPRKPTVLNPTRFHFYEHLPANRSKEEFSRVSLKFEHGAFRDPRWHSYPVVPEAIESARSALQEGL